MRLRLKTNFKETTSSLAWEDSLQDQPDLPPLGKAFSLTFSRYRITVKVSNYTPFIKLEERPEEIGRPACGMDRRTANLHLNSLKDACFGNNLVYRQRWNYPLSAGHNTPIPGYDDLPIDHYAATQHHGAAAAAGIGSVSRDAFVGGPHVPTTFMGQSCRGHPVYDNTAHQDWAIDSGTSGPGYGGYAFPSSTDYAINNSLVPDQYSDSFDHAVSVNVSNYQYPFGHTTPDLTAQLSGGVPSSNEGSGE